MWGRADNCVTAAGELRPVHTDGGAAHRQFSSGYQPSGQRHSADRPGLPGHQFLRRPIQCELSFVCWLCAALCARLKGPVRLLWLMPLTPCSTWHGCAWLLSLPDELQRPTIPISEWLDRIQSGTAWAEQSWLQHHAMWVCAEIETACRCIQGRPASRTCLLR